jgi:hypothetical protein
MAKKQQQPGGGSGGKGDGGGGKKPVGDDVPSTLVPYPDSFPTEAAGVLLSFIRGTGQVPLDRVALGGWNIQGFAMSQLIGHGGGKGEGATLAMGREELTSTLERLCGEGGGEGEEGKEPALAAVDWRSLVLAVMAIVEQVIQQLLS